MKLYNPVKSDRKHKKYMVMTKKGIIHFGDNRYGQFKDKLGHYKKLDHHDPKRKKAYYARHGKAIGRDNAKYWSHKILW